MLGEGIREDSETNAVTDLESEISGFKTDLEKGYAILIQALQEKNQNYTYKDLQRFFIPSYKFEELQNNETILQQVEKGEPLYRFLGFSEDDIYEIYLVVVSLLNLERDQDAYYVAKLLTTFAHNVSAFWHIYGISLFRLERFEEAVDAFKAALTIEPENYEPALFAIQALYKLGRKEEADVMLHDSVEEAKHNNDLESVELFSELHALNLK